ncbi:hypothetical protein ACP4OV_007496 [Aristida adscensionis]
MSQLVKLFTMDVTLATADFGQARHIDLWFLEDYGARRVPSSMPPKKVRIQRIVNTAARRATFKTRCAGLFKKAGELATLCGVDVCVAVRGEGEPRPALWPSPEAAALVMNRFNELPDVERSRNMMDLRAFVKLQESKLVEKVKKLRRENEERETLLLLLQVRAGRRPGLIGGLTPEEVSRLGCMVARYIEIAKKELARRRGQGQGVPAPPPALQLPLVTLPPPSLPPALQMPPPSLPPALQMLLLASLPPPPQPRALQVPLASLSPVPYTIDVGQTSQPQSWMMDMGGAGGDLGGVVYGGGYGSFVGGDAFGGGNLPLLGDGGDGTSGAGGSMLQLLLGDDDAELEWGDAGAGPSSGPTM